MASAGASVSTSVDYSRFDAIAKELDEAEQQIAKDEKEKAGAVKDSKPKGAGAGGMQLDNGELSPLFWDSIPENADEHPDKMALDALLEEDTLEERADNLKRNGNQKLKVAQQTKRKLYYREAIAFYSQALDLKCSDRELNAVLHSNRAQVNLILGNYAKALEDALQAISLDDTAIKSYYRAARAALKSCKWGKCRELCRLGLALDPDAGEFKAIEKEAAKEEDKEMEAKERELKSTRALRTSAVSLAMYVTSRGWRLGRPQFSVGSNTRPTVDEEGMVHWPVLLMYPEVMANDSIEDFHEATPISAHIDQMFGPEAPPLPWDEKGEYTRESLELYYLAHCAKPLTEDQVIDVFMGKSPEGFEESGPSRFGAKSAQWVRVNEADALGELLQRADFVIPGIPVLFAVAKGTEFRERFLANEVKMWKS